MRRVEAVDLARAVALLGMMATHLGPSWSGNGAPPVSEIVAGGRAAPLFALLAGVSLGLVGRSRPEQSLVRPTLLRAGCLLVIGLALASLPGLQILVILPVYAVLLVAVLPLRTWTVRPLLWFGGLWTVAGPLVLLGLRRLVDRPAEAAVQQSFADPGELVRLPVDLLVWGPYPAVVWLAYVVVGLGLASLDLRSAATGRWLVAIGMLVTAAAAWLGTIVIEAGLLEDRFGQPRWWHLMMPPQWLDPTDPESLLAAGQHTSTPLNVVGATGSAVLVLGVAVLLTVPRRSRTVLGPLVAAGSMTLTLYVVHVVLTWADDEHGWEIVGGTYGAFAGQAVIVVVAATAWRTVFRRGPIEELVHRAAAGSPATTKAPSPEG